MSDFFFLFNQKTAYEMRISDWSSDVCSADLVPAKRRTWPDHRCGRGRNPTLRTGRGGRGKSAKQRPGRTDGELVYLYTPIHSRPVARGAIASIQDGFVVGRWISVEKALHRPIGRASCRERVCQEGSI